MQMPTYLHNYEETLFLRMKRTVTKIGDGAFADVYRCQNETWDKLAIKVNRTLYILAPAL